MEASANDGDPFAGLNNDALKALLRAQQSELQQKDNELQSNKLLIEQLKLQIAKLKRMQFGKSSEKIENEILQLTLELEKLEDNQALREYTAEPQVLPTTVARVSKPRRVFPDHLPREIETYQPTEEYCPDCGGAFKYLGEDVSELLEIEPVRFKVLQRVRPKHACVNCDKIVQAPAPSRPIDRGMAGPGLLAHVLVNKFSDHIPLYRQSAIFARQGIELDRSLLAQWVGRAHSLLQPLYDALQKHVLAGEVLHADDTTLPVLEPGLGKTKIGRLWTYVRDERPQGASSAPAVWFVYSPNRKGEHPQEHLKNYCGILQADGYSGYTKLYESGNILEAACFAHARRKFYDLFQANKSEIAHEALERIKLLYLIEQEIYGKTAEVRKRVRQERSRPILDSLHAWLQQTLPTLSQKSATALAIQYTLKRWEALTRFCDDGRLAIDNNAAERALRCVALGRKNFLFAGNDQGGVSAANLYSLIGTAKLNGYDPEAFLREVLTRIGDHPISRVEEFLPWNISTVLPIGGTQVELPA